MEIADARDCRHIALAAMAAQPGRTFTVAELAEELGRQPLVVPGRPGKLVSDALRVAVARGWVVRPSRGRYRLAGIAPTTLRRSRRWCDGLGLGLSRHQRMSYSNWRPVAPNGPVHS